MDALRMWLEEKERSWGSSTSSCSLSLTCSIGDESARNVPEAAIGVGIDCSFSCSRGPGRMTGSVCLNVAGRRCSAWLFAFFGEGYGRAAVIVWNDVEFERRSRCQTDRRDCRRTVRQSTAVGCRTTSTRSERLLALACPTERSRAEVAKERT